MTAPIDPRIEPERTLKALTKLAITGYVWGLTHSAAIFPTVTFPAPRSFE